MLQIYNTLTQKKEKLIPIIPGQVSIYICGITVYDECHIGHARSSILFDMITRYLRVSGYKVKYVRNITDIDDKIIKRANENQESIDSLTSRMIERMHQDEYELGNSPPDYEPRATKHIPQMIALIMRLVESDHAYVSEKGDVYFDVTSFKDYGKLSGRDIEQLQAGVRIDINEQKRNPLDFVLWKMSKKDEPFWDSPWGKGRPGWHIECSAMSLEILGQPFDIHGGGMDLKFPHHENEIAQSQAGCDKKFANIWMHAGLLQVNKEKMSKSLGNFFTIREVLQTYHPEVIRYFMLSAHYRSPVNYTEETLKKGQQSLISLYTALRGLPAAETIGAQMYKDQFHVAMDDDFNTPEALAVMFALVHEINRLKEQGELEQAAQHAATLKLMGSVFGLLDENPEIFLQGSVDKEYVAKIEALIAARNVARAEKNWGEADRLRDELQAMDIQIEDGSGGTTWRRG